jgi:excisionase family DNA binding protein
MPWSNDPFAYRINDACHLLSIGRSSIYNMIRDGQLKPIRIAGRTLIPRTEIDRLLAEALNDA